MIKQANPYCALPFYQGSMPDAEADCPLYSPTVRLPMFQVELNDVEVSGDVDAYLERLDTGAQTAIPGIEVFNADNGNCYVTYPGTDLASPASEGMYRVRLTSAELTLDYLSHPLCLSRAFNPQDWDAQVSCLPSGDDFQFTVSFDAHPGMPTEIEVDYLAGAGYQRIGDGLNESPPTFVASLAPLDTVKLRIKVWIHDALFYKEYSFAFDPDDPDPCTTGSLTFLNAGGDGYERFVCLEWQNTKDIQTLGLMYSGVIGQNGFLQQMYVEAWASMAGTVAEENFLKNGQGQNILDSLEIARLYNIQFYGLPDACISPLRAANAHNVRQLRQTADEWSAGLTSIDVTPEEVAGTHCAKCTLSVEMNRALVGCQDNVNEIV